MRCQTWLSKVILYVGKNVNKIILSLENSPIKKVNFGRKRKEIKLNNSTTIKEKSKNIGCFIEAVRVDISF